MGGVSRAGVGGVGQRAQSDWAGTRRGGSWRAAASHAAPFKTSLEDPYEMCAAAHHTQGGMVVEGEGCALHLGCQLGAGAVGALLQHRRPRRRARHQRRGVGARCRAQGLQQCGRCGSGVGAQSQRCLGHVLLLVEREEAGLAQGCSGGCPQQGTVCASRHSSPLSRKPLPFPLVLLACLFRRLWIHQNKLDAAAPTWRLSKMQLPVEPASSRGGTGRGGTGGQGMHRERGRARACNGVGVPSLECSCQCDLRAKVGGGDLGMPPGVRGSRD